MTSHDAELVSILIPCYNGEPFIFEAVESALAQTHGNVEVIVVDDGSIDDSVKRLRSFGDRIVLESERNQGACVARNRAFKLSKGEFIQFLDADDKLAPHKIEQQLPLLLNDQADMVLCKLGLFGDEKGERPEKRPHPEPTGDPFLYFAASGIGTPAPLYRRSFIERSGGFLPGLQRGQEADFHLRVAALNPRLAMVDGILVWVRMHAGPRISRQEQQIDEVVTTLCHLAKYMNQHDAWTSERRALIATQLLQASRACFSHGSRTIAREGLRKAIDISPAVLHKDRPARQCLTKLLGAENAEWVVVRVRSLLKKRLAGPKSQRTERSSSH